MQAYLNRIKGFTQKAMEAVLHAQVHALRLRQSRVDTYHLLFGLLDTQETIALRILTRLHVTTEQVQTELLAVAPQGEGHMDTEALMQSQMTDTAERVLTSAREEAQELGCSPRQISTSYLLLGLLREETGLAAQILNRLGVELEAVRNIVAENPNE